MAVNNSGFHRAVAAELDRHKRLGYTSEHDDQHDIEHLINVAMSYIENGQTVKGYAMLVAAKAYLARNKKNPMQTAIEEFMRRCDQEVKAYPELPEEKIVTLRIRLMVEELLGAVNPAEFLEHGPNRYVGLLIQNKSDELVASMLRGDLVGIADGLADVLYVVFGTAIAYGIDIQEVFDEVHRSNLSKTVWSEELQRYTIEKDEFGKGIKPPTYSPAAIEPIILRQIQEGEALEAFLADQSNESEAVVATIEV